MQKAELIEKDILIHKVQKMLIKEYGDIIVQDFDTYDFEANIDGTLTVEENYEDINDDFKILFKKKIDERANKEKMQEAEHLLKQENHREEGLFKQQANYLIVGKTGSGKTSLGWHCAFMIYMMQKKKVYVYRFPRAELLTKLPFKVTNINQLEQLYQITDGVVLIDESQNWFDVLNKQTNEKLKNLLALSRQNNTDFIFICHNSYFITRNLFSFIDVRMIKEVNTGQWDLEREHMRKLYQNIVIAGRDKVFIDSDYDRGEQTIKMPEWFTEELSLVYRYVKESKCYFEELLKKYAR